MEENPYQPPEHDPDETGASAPDVPIVILATRILANLGLGILMMFLLLVVLMIVFKFAPVSGAM